MTSILHSVEVMLLCFHLRNAVNEPIGMTHLLSKFCNTFSVRLKTASGNNFWNVFPVYCIIT